MSLGTSTSANSCFMVSFPRVRARILRPFALSLARSKWTTQRRSASFVASSFLIASSMSSTLDQAAHPLLEILDGFHIRHPLGHRQHFLEADFDTPPVSLHDLPIGGPLSLPGS